MSMEKVAILGASVDPGRFAYKAFRQLRSHGHQVFPVSPKITEVEGVKVYPKLQDIPEKIDTLTMYVGPQISSQLKNEILALKPRRVIFNPGSENPEVISALEQANIQAVRDCTLIMLGNGEF